MPLDVQRKKRQKIESVFTALEYDSVNALGKPFSVVSGGHSRRHWVSRCLDQDCQRQHEISGAVY